MDHSDALAWLIRNVCEYMYTHFHFIHLQCTQKRANLFLRAKRNLTDFDDWIRAQTLFGITTYYRREVDGTLSIKLEGHLTGIPLFEQLCVLREVDLYHSWAPFCVSSSRLAQLGKIDVVAWFLTGLPKFGLSRDACFRAIGCDSMREDGSILLVGEGLGDRVEDGVNVKPYLDTPSSGGGAVASNLTNLSFGTSGSGTGSGGAVTVTNQGVLISEGRNAMGLLAQSIGGGGGLTGHSSGSQLTLGGSLQGRGNGGAVTVTNTGAITTLGINSAALLALILLALLLLALHGAGSESAGSDSAASDSAGSDSARSDSAP